MQLRLEGLLLWVIKQASINHTVQLSNCIARCLKWDTSEKIKTALIFLYTIFRTTHVYRKCIASLIAHLSWSRAACARIPPRSDCDK